MLPTRFFIFKALFFEMVIETSALYIPENKIQGDNCGMKYTNVSFSREKNFNYEITGYDYENVPVSIMNWGRWDVTWLVENPSELEKFSENVDHFVEEVGSGKMFRRFRNETASTVSYVTILDFDGLDLRELFSQQANQFIVKMFSKLQEIAGNLSFGYILNANPLANQIINMAKPLMGNFLERIEVYGTNSQVWIPKILKRIPKSQLPPALGGSKDYEPVATCYFI